MTIKIFPGGRAGEDKEEGTGATVPLPSPRAPPMSRWYWYYQNRLAQTLAREISSATASGSRWQIHKKSKFATKSSNDILADKQIYQIVQNLFFSRFKKKTLTNTKICLTDQRPSAKQCNKEAKFNVLSAECFLKFSDCGCFSTLISCCSASMGTIVVCPSVCESQMYLG